MRVVPSHVAPQKFLPCSRTATLELLDELKEGDGGEMSMYAIERFCSCEVKLKRCTGQGYVKFEPLVSSDSEFVG